MKAGRQSKFKSTYLWWAAAFFVVIVLSFKLPVGQQLNIFFAPLLHTVQAPVRWYQDLSRWFEDSARLQARNLVLEQYVAQQDALSQELTTLRTENLQLRAFLNITKIEGYVWRVASVVSRGPEKKSRRLMLQINQAQADDVIVSHEGLVGLVDTAGEQHAVVRTILDASIAVPVTMEGSNLAGLVRGDGEHLLVDFVPLAKAPKAGDILITSGAGGIFPAGLPVAQVLEVNSIDGGVFVEVVASPVAYWERDAWLAVAQRQVTE